jgi:hypothetical protein
MSGLKQARQRRQPAFSREKRAISAVGASGTAVALGRVHGDVFAGCAADTKTYKVPRRP